VGDEGREGGGVGQERPVGLSGLLGCLLGAVLASAAAEQVRVRPLCHIAFLFLQKLAAGASVLQIASWWPLPFPLFGGGACSFFSPGLCLHVG